MPAVDFFHVDCAITVKRIYVLFRPGSHQPLRTIPGDEQPSDLDHQRIRRRPILGGLINEYESAA